MAVRTPSAWQVAAVAAVIGCVVGAGSASIRATFTPWQIGTLAPRVTDVPPDAPRAEVPETRHAFGTIGTGESGSHRFMIRNAGGGPLTLTRGSTSCSCTVSDFESDEGGSQDAKKVVPPGGETFVTVQWQGKPPGGPFRQQATILTDDPRRPEVAFVVEGAVVPVWRAVPEAIVLSTLSSSAGQRASVTIFTYGQAAPEVESISIDDSQAAQFFSLAASPLSAAELAAAKPATGGFRIDVDVRPGLPLGRLRHTVRATFTMPEQVVAAIPLEGNVGGDLVLAGPGWDSSRHALMLGTVSGRTGLRTRVFLSAKGPHRDSVRPTVQTRVPDLIEVTIGEPAPVGSGAVVRIPIDIEIPPGSRAVNHICSEQAPAGRIVLATGHPDAPTFSIPVCVAIGP